MAIMILAISMAANIIIGIIAKSIWDCWKDDNKMAQATIRSLQLRCNTLEKEVEHMKNELAMSKL